MKNRKELGNPNHDKRDNPYEEIFELLGVNQGDDPYEKIGNQEIESAEETYPLRAELMKLANENLTLAQAQAEGEVLRTPEYHDLGWRITIETNQGLVGIWNNWLGNRLFIGYPHEMIVTDEIIKNILDVRDAYPVDQVSAVAVMDPDYEGEFKDSDKPLVVNDAGQIVAYRSEGERLWAPFFGNEIVDIDNGGRVWIDHKEHYSEGQQFPYITKNGEKREVSMGHSSSRVIATFPYNFANKYAYEGPVTKKEAIQAYKDRFIMLATEIAKQLGTILSVSINYHHVLVPEDLEKEGYTDIEWITGNWGQRKGFGNEHVIAKKDNMTVSLESGTSLVPWSTTVRYELSEEEIENLARTINDELLYF